MLKYYEQKASKKEDKEGKLFSKHIFGHQFSQNIKSLSVWTLIIAALMTLVIALYPAFKDMMPDIMAGLDETMKEIFGAMGGTFDNIVEFYALEAGQVYVLVGAIYAAMLGFKLIKTELENGSFEFLYTQPVSRAKIFKSKLAVLFVNIFLFNLVVTTTSFLAMYIVNGAIDFNVGYFLLYSLFSLVINLQIGVIIFATAAILKKKASLGLTIGLPVLVYFIGLISQLSSLVGGIGVLKYFTPFSYILNGVIIEGLPAVNLLTFAIWSGFTIFMLTLSYVNFKKSDII